MSSWTERLFQLSTLITVTIVVLGFQKLYSNEESNDRNVAKAMFIICSVVGLFLGSVKVLFVFLEKTNKSGLLERCNFNRAFGCFVIVLCGIISRIYGICLSNVDYQVIYAFGTTCLIIVNIAYFLFVAGTNKYCIRDKIMTKKIAKWVVSIHVIILIISLFLVPTSYTIDFSSRVGNRPRKTYPRTYEFSENQRVVLYLYQLIFACLTLSGCQEIFEILHGAIQLKANEEVELEEVRVERLGEEVNNDENGAQECGHTKSPVKPECTICVSEYSEPSRVPRILKECGHTLCEACVDKLLMDHTGNHIFCPLCQAVTVVHGPASTLPKNYEVIYAMDLMRA